MFIIAQEQYPETDQRGICGECGRGGDLVTRVLLGKAEKFRNQPFVFNNQSGRRFRAARRLRKSGPDGYNLVTTPGAPLTWIPILGP
jgi:hypothetical protein